MIVAMNELIDHPPLGLAGSTGFIRGVGVVVILAAAALAVAGYHGDADYQDWPERTLSGLALGAVVAVPGIVCLLALADRTALLLPGAALLVPLSFLSLAGVLLPLLIAAAMLFVAYGRRTAARDVDNAQTAVATIVVVIFVIAAVVALFAHQDPRTYTTSTGSGSTSDVVSSTESLISLGLSTVAVAGGWILTTPSRRFE
jgi:hypothetical protein